MGPFRVNENRWLSRHFMPYDGAESGTTAARVAGLEVKPRVFERSSPGELLQIFSHNPYMSLNVSEQRKTATRLSNSMQVSSWTTGRRGWSLFCGKSRQSWAELRDATDPGRAEVQEMIVFKDLSLLSGKEIGHRFH